MTTLNLTKPINLMIIKTQKRLQRSQKRILKSQRRKRKKAKTKIRMKKINLIKTNQKVIKTQRKKVNKINLIKTMKKTKTLSLKILTQRLRAVIPKTPTIRIQMMKKIRSNPRTARARRRRSEDNTNTAL